ncbi:hypothetical protein M0804_009652 [Polistes exclamans]|nr:hypothetical protein M0804_009652 [Polistes exclamans]
MCLCLWMLGREVACWRQRKKNSGSHRPPRGYISEGRSEDGKEKKEEKEEEEEEEEMKVEKKKEEEVTTILALCGYTLLCPSGAYSPDATMGYMMDGQAASMMHRPPGDPAFHNQYHYPPEYYGHHL